MRYSAGPWRTLAEATAATRGGKHSRNQLSHPEAVDLPRQNQDRENAGRASSRAGERDRPVDSQEAATRGYRIAPRTFQKDQRAKSIDRARAGYQVQRFAGAGDAWFRGAAHHCDHHRGCSEGNALEARGARGGADQIHGSDDSAGVRLAWAVRFKADDSVNPSFRCLVLVFCLLAFGTADAQEIRIAAAADLKFALDELGVQFEKQTGRRMNVSYGSSGNFFAQIQNGAPFALL